MGKPKFIGQQPAGLQGHFVFSLFEGCVWQQEVGEDNWQFIHEASGALDVIAFETPGLMEKYQDKAYVLVYNKMIEYSSGTRICYEETIRSVACGSSECMVLSGDCLFNGNKLIGRGLAHVDSIFVRGNDVYLCKDEKLVIFQPNHHNASCHDLEPRIHL